MAPGQSPSACLGQGSRRRWECGAQFAGRRAAGSAPGLWKPLGYHRKLQSQKGNAAKSRSGGGWLRVDSLQPHRLRVCGSHRQEDSACVGTSGLWGGDTWKRLGFIQTVLQAASGRRMIKNNINLQHTYSMTVWTWQLLEEHS